MSATLKPSPVKKSVTVEAPLETAFAVFTKGFGRWWPASHSIGKSPQKLAVMEPRAGGRWYEIGEDGNECEWGEVLEWEKPTRVLLAWRIGQNWTYDPALYTEVEIRFTPLDHRKTKVELEHRLLENMGDKAELARQSFEGGWAGLMEAYRAMAANEAA